MRGPLPSSGRKEWGNQSRELVPAPVSDRLNACRKNAVADTSTWVEVRTTGYKKVPRGRIRPRLGGLNSVSPMNLESLIWPSVAFLLGSVAIVVLRKSLGRLIDRITHIDKTGIKAASQEIAAVTKEEEKPLTARDVMEVGCNEVIKNQERSIQEAIGNIRFSTSEEKEAFLLRALARSQIYAHFDRISMLIFGSQLGIVVHANSQPAGIGEDVVKTAFEAVKKGDPLFHEATSYDSYKGFLLNTNVLFWEGERLKITMFGKEFLKFLVDNGLTHQRRG